MCVATLNVSALSCAHRWYEIVQPCQPTTNLDNCSEKLKLQGWENLTDDCPWCDVKEPMLREGSHKLLGSAQSGASTPTSPTMSDLDSISPSRVDSFGALSSLSALSRHTSSASTESEAGQRHREMNERLEIYLTTHPHEILPSAAKNSPTYSRTSTVKSQTAGQMAGSSARGSGAKVASRFKKSVRLSVNFMRP